MTIAVILLVAAGAPACRRQEALVRPCDDPALLAEFRAFSAVPLSPSPDGTKVAYSSQNERFPYGMEIREAGSERSLLKCYSPEPMMRATWRPDGLALAYFRQTATTERQLYIWDLLRDSHALIETPSTHNQYDVSWSPDGSTFAFTSDAKEFIVVRPPGKILRREGAIRRFVWSPDSTRIALLLEDRRDTVVFFSMETGADIETIRIETPQRLVSLAWAPHPTLLLRGQDKAANVSTLYRVNPVSKKVTATITVQGEASQPEWLEYGKTLLWADHNAVGWQRLVVADDTGNPIRKFEYEGNINLRGFAPGRTGLFLSLISPAKNQIIRVAVGDPKAVPEILAGNSNASTGIAEHATVLGPAAGSFQPRFYVSRNLRKKPRPEHAVIRMLGGQNPQFAANWGEIQFYLHHGIHYLTVPNLKDHGVVNLLAACRYARDTLKVPSANIVVYGASTAASVAIDTSITEPNAFGLLVVAGVVNRPAMTYRDYTVPRPRIFAFHGGRDPVPPRIGKTILDDTLGADATEAPNGMWHVFPDEPHSFALAEANVHATILKGLGLADPPPIK